MTLDVDLLVITRGERSDEQFIPLTWAAALREPPLQPPGNRAACHHALDPMSPGREAE